MTDTIEEQREQTAAGFRALYREIRNMYAQAVEDSERLNAPEIRLLAMQGVIRSLRDLYRLAVKNRSGQNLENEATAIIDRDLRPLGARLNMIYERFDPSFTPAESGDPVEFWSDFVHDYEGPILTWTRKEAAENWGIPFGAPPPPGPDLLNALQLVNMSSVSAAEEFDRRNVLRRGLGAVLDGVAAFWSEQARTLGPAARDSLSRLGEKAQGLAADAADYVDNTIADASKKAAFGLFESPFLYLAAGAAIVYALTTGAKKR